MGCGASSEQPKDSVKPIEKKVEEKHEVKEEKKIEPSTEHQSTSETTTSNEATVEKQSNEITQTNEAVVVAPTQTSNKKFVLEVRILSASDLPKTDTLSKCDPWVSVEVDGIKKRTKKIDETYDPIYNEKFIFRNVTSASDIKFKIFDADIMSDDYIGSVKVDFNKIPIRSELSEVELVTGISKRDDLTPKIKYSVNVFPEYSYMKETLGGQAGVICVDSSRMLQIPIPLSDTFKVEGVYLNIDYEGDDKVDLKLLETISAKSQGYELNFGYSLPTNFKIKKNISDEKTRIGEIDVVATTKFDDLDFSELSHVLIKSSKVEVVWNDTMEKIVVAHGWAGMMDYNKAKETLTNVVFDDKHQSIYFTTEYGSLKNDFDSDNIDVSFAVSEEKFNEGYTTDLHHNKAKNQKRTFYSSPKEVTGLRLSMEAGLDDLPTPLIFNEIDLKVTKHTESHTFSLQSFLPSLFEIRD